MNFINRELVLALCLVAHTPVWVNTRACGPHVLVFGSHLNFMSLVLCPGPPPLVYPLSSFTLSLQTNFELTSFP